MNGVLYKSYAKINLGLEILFRRSDNYHTINSVFIPIDLYDEILFSFSDSFNIEQNPKTQMITLKENIIFKTLKLMKNIFKINISKLSIKLFKKIPIGAGLGGGSSNAATTIKAINALFNLNLTLDQQISIASEIGSDVPFFIYNKISIVSGRGEKIKTLQTYLPFKFLVVYPNIKISTTTAYSWLNISKSKRPTNFEEALSIVTIEPKNFKKLFHNDFEEVLFDRFPILLKIKKNLEESGAIYSSVSGSGSSIFGIFPIESKIPDLSVNFPFIQQFQCNQVK